MENWLFLFVDSIYTLCSQFSKRWIPITTQTNIHHVFYQTNKSSSKFQIISLFAHLFTLIFPIRLNPSSFLLFLSPNTYFISPNTNNSTNNNSTLFRVHDHTSPPIVSPHPTWKNTPSVSSFNNSPKHPSSTHIDILCVLRFNHILGEAHLLLFPLFCSCVIHLDPKIHQRCDSICQMAGASSLSFLPLQQFLVLKNGSKTILFYSRGYPCISTQSSLFYFLFF